MQASDSVHCSLCYPFKKFHNQNFVTSLLLARNFLLASLFSFQGTDSNLFQGQIEMLTRLSKHFNPNLKRSGGDKRNRTAGLLLARQALSQLSYTPTSRKIQVVGPSGLEPPTSRLSVVRSSQLSYGPAELFSRAAVCTL